MSKLNYDKSPVLPDPVGASIFLIDFSYNSIDTYIFTNITCTFRRIVHSYHLSSVTSLEGEIVNLTKVTRSEMGAYLCIAANGVPPSVSKRIMLHVHCEYY